MLITELNHLEHAKSDKRCSQIGLQCPVLEMGASQCLEELQFLPFGYWDSG